MTSVYDNKMIQLLANSSSYYVKATAWAPTSGNQRAEPLTREVMLSVAYNSCNHMVQQVVFMGYETASFPLKKYHSHIHLCANLHCNNRSYAYNKIYTM